MTDEQDAHILKLEAKIKRMRAAEDYDLRCKKSLRAEIERLSAALDRERRLSVRTNLENERLTRALEDIALLDECDGHELAVRHAFKAVAIATSTLGKHPSEIAAGR